MLVLLAVSLPQDAGISTDFGLGNAPDIARVRGVAGRVREFVSVPTYGEEFPFEIKSLKKK
jgi:hypothetical protein